MCPADPPKLSSVPPPSSPLIPFIPFFQFKPLNPLLANGSCWVCPRPWAPAALFMQPAGRPSGTYGDTPSAALFNCTADREPSGALWKAGAPVSCMEL